MIRAEQLIYTASNVRGKKGYQVAARSRGIGDGIESELRPHFHPPGIRPDGFRESHSLAHLADGRMAYCHARNIGAGYDGRRDTLCSHALVLTRRAFAEIGCDTRVLAPLHPGRRRMRGAVPAVELDPLQAAPPPPPPSPADMRALRPVFAGALRLLLDGRRVAVPSADPTMAQKFLALLPPSARLVQFSSVPGDAARQTRCRLVFYPPGKRPGRSAGFAVAAEGSESGGDGDDDAALGRAVRHYAETALGGGTARLGRIMGRFEAAPSLSCRDRMVLACAYEQFLECGDEAEKRVHAEDAFSAAKSLDPPAFSRHFGAIKDYVGTYRRAVDGFRSDPKSAPDLFGTWLDSFPLAIGMRMFNAFLDSYSRRGSAAADAGAGAGE